MGSKTILNARNTPLDEQAGSLPYVNSAMDGYFQPMKFGRVEKVVSGFHVSETVTEINFMGVIHPLKPDDLWVKPEGQRNWTWFELHADPVLALKLDEIVIYRGKQTRVMARNDFTKYGYISYHLVQDWVKD